MNGSMEDYEETYRTVLDVNDPAGKSPHLKRRVKITTE